MKREADREILIQVARTSLRTKVHRDLADLLTEVSFNTVSVLKIKKERKQFLGAIYILEVICGFLQFIALTIPLYPRPPLSTPFALTSFSPCPPKSFLLTN